MRRSVAALTYIGFTFEASDRSRSLSLAQINNLGSDLSLASIVKIARCLQVFVLTSTFLGIRFTRKVSPLDNALFGLQYLEFTYYPSPAMASPLHQDCKNAIEAMLAAQFIQMIK